MIDGFKSMLENWPCVSNFPSIPESFESWKKTLRPCDQLFLFPQLRAMSVQLTVF